ncbi:unnamed protein product, partial [Protopolystoma xenopodis]
MTKLDSISGKRNKGEHSFTQVTDLLSDPMELVATSFSMANTNPNSGALTTTAVAGSSTISGSSRLPLIPIATSGSVASEVGARCVSFPTEYHLLLSGSDPGVDNGSISQTHHQLIGSSHHQVTLVELAVPESSAGFMAVTTTTTPAIAVSSTNGSPGVNGPLDSQIFVETPSFFKSHQKSGTISTLLRNPQTRHVAREFLDESLLNTATRTHRRATGLSGFDDSRILSTPVSASTLASASPAPMTTVSIPQPNEPEKQQVVLINADASCLEKASIVPIYMTTSYGKRSPATLIEVLTTSTVSDSAVSSVATTVGSGLMQTGRQQQQQHQSLVQACQAEQLLSQKLIPPHGSDETSGILSDHSDGSTGFASPHLLTLPHCAATSNAASILSTGPVHLPDFVGLASAASLCPQHGHLLLQRQHQIHFQQQQNYQTNISTPPPNMSAAAVSLLPQSMHGLVATDANLLAKPSLSSDEDQETSATQIKADYLLDKKTPMS